MYQNLRGEVKAIQRGKFGAANAYIKKEKNIPSGYPNLPL